MPGLVMSKVVAAGLLFTLLAPLDGQAGECVPPPNEDCAGAIVFTTTDLPFEVSAPLGCLNDIVDKPYFDIFYRFDCTASGTHVIHMCDSAGDTYIRIYTDGCGWSDGVELAVADDECPGSPPNADPLLAIELQAGQSYWLELGTWRADPPWGALRCVGHGHLLWRGRGGIHGLPHAGPGRMRRSGAV